MDKHSLVKQIIIMVIAKGNKNLTWYTRKLAKICFAHRQLCFCDRPHYSSLELINTGHFWIIVMHNCSYILKIEKQTNYFVFYADETGS